MGRSFDLDPVERITAGAVGEPGERTFFIQARAQGEQVTLLAEKEQVALLAQAIGQVLKQIEWSEDEGPEPPEQELELDVPLDPEWRAGSMSIEYDEDADRIAIVVQEAQPARDEEEEEEVIVEPEEEPAVARFVTSRAQARAMAMHALKVVAAGRPRCQFCGEPLEPEGPHICAAMNGHRKPKE